MSTKLLIAAACTMIGALAAPAALAQAAPIAAPAAIDPFAQAIAARQVADFARRERDPLAMLTAARMLQQIPVTDSGAADDAAFTPAGLFAEAKALAKGDQPLLMQIQVAQTTGSRGVMSSAFGKGLVRSVQDVGGKAAYRFTLQAQGGQPLRIGAIGDMGTALYIRLLDSAGKTVCLDDNADYAPVCAVTPKKPGSYRVDIVNKSAAKSRTVILSN